MILFFACVAPPDEPPVHDPDTVDTVEPDTLQVAPTWTVLVYIVGDNDLEGWVMHELEAGGPGREVRVIALADRAEGYAENGGDWTDTAASRRRRPVASHDGRRRPHPNAAPGAPSPPERRIWRAVPTRTPRTPHLARRPRRTWRLKLRQKPPVGRGSD